VSEYEGKRPETSETWEPSDLHVQCPRCGGTAVVVIESIRVTRAGLFRDGGLFFTWSCRHCGGEGGVGLGGRSSWWRRARSRQGLIGRKHATRLR
jgi:rubredoxin